MKRIIELSCIFLLIIVIFVIVQPKIKIPENYENKLVNNNIVSDNVYKISTDLDYASMRYGLNLNHTDKISKNQIAPILNPQSYEPRSILWGNAPAVQNTTRQHDNWSNNKEYKHPIDSIL
jgi:hypothetical protein